MADQEGKVSRAQDKVDHAQKAVDQVNGQVKELTDADNEAKAASDAANKDLAAKKAAESEAEQEYQALPKVVANDALKRKNLLRRKKQLLPLKRRLMKRLTRSRQLTLSLLKPNKNSQAPKATCLLSKQL